MRVTLSGNSIDAGRLTCIFCKPVMNIYLIQELSGHAY